MGILRHFIIIKFLQKTFNIIFKIFIITTP